MKTHERTHTWEKPYICSTCVKAYMENDTLKKHEMIHKEEKPLVFIKCGKASNTVAI